MGNRSGQKKWVECGATGRLLLAVLATGCATVRPPPPCAQPAVSEEQSSAKLPVTLTAEQIVRVIAAVTPRIKEQCWQPGLDARALDAPSTARLLVQARIDPSGSVTSAHTEDSTPAYPQLPDCVVKLVLSLSFDRTQTATVANIPFIFGAPDAP